MKSVGYVFWMFVSTLLLPVGHAENSNSLTQKADSKTIKYSQLVPSDHLSYIEVLNGRPVMLGGEGNELKLLSMDGKTNTSIASVQPDHQIVAANLVAENKVVVAAWSESPVDKKRSRKISSFIAVSRDEGASFADIKALNKDGMSLLGSAVVIDSGERLAAAVLERGENKIPQIRLLSSKGDEWQELVLAKASEQQFWSAPQYIAKGNQHWVGWKMSKGKEAEYHILHSSDGMKTWKSADPLNVHAESVGMALNRTSNSLFFTRIEPNKGLVISQLADGPASWKDIEMPALEQDFHVEGYSATAGANDALHFLFGFSPSTGTHRKQAIYYTQLDPNGNFLPMRALNTTTPVNSITASRASLAVDSTGQNVLVVWQDLRLYRSTILANFSSDAGKTWKDKDFYLGSGQGKVWENTPVIQHYDNDRFVVAWNVFADGKENDGIGVIRLVGASEVHAKPEAPNPDLLTERVAQYWQLRKQDMHEKTFDIYDPFYRVKTNAKVHAEIRRRIKINIHDFQIGETHSVTPRRTVVEVSYEHSIPEFVLSNGKKVKVDRTWSDTKQEWIWIDDNWFLVYKDLIGKGVIRY